MNADVLFVAGDYLTATNMFAYANGNPVMMVDFDGMSAALNLLVTLGGMFIRSVELMSSESTLEIVLGVLVFGAASLLSLGLIGGVMLAGLTLLIGAAAIVVGALTSWDADPLVDRIIRGVELTTVALTGVNVLFTGLGYVMIGIGRIFESIRSNRQLSIYGYGWLHGDDDVSANAMSVQPFNDIPIQVSRTNNVQLAMIFYNARPPYAYELTMARLSADLSRHPNVASVEWGQTGNTDNIVLPQNRFSTETVVTAINGQGRGVVYATGRRANGNYYATGRVEVFSMTFLDSAPIGTIRNDNTDIGFLTGRPTARLPAGHRVTMMGAFGNQFLVSTWLGPGRGTATGFLGAHAINIPGETGNIVWPTPSFNGTRTAVISSNWGWRTADPPPRFHYGIDIQCVTGTVVVAVMDGIVEDTSIVGTAGRRTVMIHPDNHNFRTVYSHLLSWTVQENVRVASGVEIAISGSSVAGGPTGVIDRPDRAHLHFEIWRGTSRETAINPIPTYNSGDSRWNSNWSATNPNPFFIQSGNVYEFNPNFDWTKANGNWNGIGSAWAR